MLNVKGREPQGIVDREDYVSLRDKVIDELSILKDPYTYENIIENVYRREDLYSGPYVSEAPDIVLSLKDTYKASNSLTVESIFSDNSEDNIKGSHKINGVFIASGPDIVTGKRIDGANILDVMPTILTLMDVDIPKNLDGRVLTNIIN